MNLTKLERATRLYAKIKVLDSEIIEIDRFAMIVANGDIKATLELTIEDPAEKVEAISDPQESAWDRFAREHGIRILELGSATWKPPNHKNQVLNRTISESTTLSILGVLLYEKQTQRKKLLDELDTIGIVIK